MSTRKKTKAIIKIIISLIIIAGSLCGLQRLLIPKYASGIVEGALIAEYYEEVKDHDVIFIGDCEVYENFSPQILWDKYGINSYIRGSAQQLIWQSYYLLEDTLQYETPQVVIFNVLAMKYDEPQKEAYNRMTLDGMKWSIEKIDAINSSMTNEEKLLDYVFPILRYHSRWKELTVEDMEYISKRPHISHNGYYMRVDVKAAENVPEGRPLGNYEFGSNAYTYLEQITKLCKENNIQLILIKAPSLYPYWYDEWDKQISDYANKNNLLYINFLNVVDDIGIDYEKDTYDGGLHMNLSGAEKLTDYLGNYLMENTDLYDRRGEEKLSEAWKQKKEYYEDDKENQYKKIKEVKEDELQ